MLIEAFEYKQWSDLRILDAIKQIDGQLFEAEWAFALQQLNHIVIVEELFRARLEERPAPHEHTNSIVVPDLDVLKQRWCESNQWYAHYVANFDSSDRQRKISFIFADGNLGCMTYTEIFFHIINHATYHRGAISHVLDLAKVPHPADTYTTFAHAMEPERREVLGAN